MPAFRQHNAEKQNHPCGPAIIRLLAFYKDVMPSMLSKAGQVEIISRKRSNITNCEHNRLSPHKIPVVTGGPAETAPRQDVRSQLTRWSPTVNAEGSLVSTVQYMIRYVHQFGSMPANSCAQRTDGLLPPNIRFDVHQQLASWRKTWKTQQTWGHDIPNRCNSLKRGLQTLQVWCKTMKSHKSVLKSHLGNLFVITSRHWSVEAKLTIIILNWTAVVSAYYYG